MRSGKTDSLDGARQVAVKWKKPRFGIKLRKLRF
jgi:hypothetical protein